MPGQALRFLEYVFLALLYLFFLRVVRAVWAETREPATVLAAVPDPTTAVAARALKGRAPPQHLVIVAPPQAKGPVFPLEGELTIGRAPGCAVSLASDNFVSHVHARLFLQDREYWVEDLGSTNGTLVNGRKVTGAVPLRRGDRLQVGRTVLELHK